MDICNVCRDALSGKSSVPQDGEYCNLDLDFIHHATAQNFLDSAFGGCRMCRRLWDQISPEKRQRIRQDAQIDEVLFEHEMSRPCMTCTLEDEDVGDDDDDSNDDSDHENSSGNRYYPFEWLYRGATLQGNPDMQEIADGQVEASLLFSRVDDQEPLRLRHKSTLSTGSPQLLPLLSLWLEACSHHSNCARPQSATTNMFTRIIDVSPRKTRLVNLDEVPADLPYITLSHCWGGIEAIKLTLANLNDMKERIPEEKLPKTFSDAVHFTRSIGVRYLWIDSLCIIQDSHDDWIDQSKVMGDIFGNSFLTIAATAAKNSHGGLFRMRLPYRIVPLRIQVPEESRQPLESMRESRNAAAGHRIVYGDILRLPPGFYDCIEPKLWTREVVESPLFRRAWVVQERLLSPRVLHFGADQLFWECSTMQACERHPSGWPVEEPDEEAIFKHYNPLMLNSAGGAAGDSWAPIVQAYSAAQLTRNSDKLTAISGIAKLLARTFHDQYLAGLWERNIVRQLLWQTHSPTARPAVYQAPTWSWASINSPVFFPVTYPAPPTERAVELIEILHAQITAEDERDSTVQVTSGRVSVRGALIPCRLETTTSEYARLPGYKLNPIVRGVDESARLFNDVEEADIDLLNFFCVPVLDFDDDEGVAVVAGLVLEHTGLKGEFQRFGLFQTLGVRHRNGRFPDAEDLFGDDRNCFLTRRVDELKEVDEKFYTKYFEDGDERLGHFGFSII